MALKQRQAILGMFSMPVGSTATAANAVCKISSSALVVATASSEASGVFVTTEAGPANGTVSCALPGSIVLVNAHDDAISEGEWLVAAAAGRVDGAAALTGGSQYILGMALQASSAQDQKISMLYMPGISPDAAS